MKYDFYQQMAVQLMS